MRLCWAVTDMLLPTAVFAMERSLLPRSSRSNEDPPLAIALGFPFHVHW